MNLVEHLRLYRHVLQFVNARENKVYRTVCYCYASLFYENLIERMSAEKTLLGITNELGIHMSQYIRLLSDMSLMAGLIGYFEYIERHEIADWLEDSNGRVPDPRVTSDENHEPLSEESSEENCSDERRSKRRIDDPPWLELLMMNQWMFTLGDVDCYPSVPHGHYKKKTREWPKLNPYTGRVFSDVHKEDVSKRLSKKDMIKLWNDSKFIEHCREQVLWYSDFAPSYGFPNARRGKLAFPRWR